MTQFAPFDESTVIARIQSEVPTLRLVGGAADYGAIKNLRDFIPPCAYVLLASEKMEHYQGLGTQQAQRSTITFGVVMAVRNYRASERGMAANDALLTVKDSVRAALQSWLPAVKGARGCQLVRGDLVDYDGATLLWTDVWQTQAFLQP